MREIGAAAIALCLLLTGCASAEAASVERPTFAVVREADFEPPTEKPEPRAEEPEAAGEPEGTRAEDLCETPPEAVEDAPDAPQACERAETPHAEEAAPEAPESAPGDDGGGAAPQGGGLTREGGVNQFGDRTETWYSSSVLRHQSTDEWEVDDEGYYRTDEGYYVVAASDLPEGTVLETSKGEAVVADSGCPDGVTDFYVNW